MSRNLQSWQNALDLAAEMMPELALLEKKRRGHLLFLTAMIPFILIILLPVIFLCALVFTKNNIPFAVISALIAGILASLYSYHSFDRDYRRQAKRIFITRIAQAMNMAYKPQGLFRIGEVYDHYLFPAYNKDLIEDGFVFTMAERQIEMQEITLLRVNDPESTRIPRFLPAKEKGLVIRIETRKAQPFHTLVIPRSFAQGHYHRAVFQGMSHYQRTPFGNPTFGKKYTVLSEEHTDAHDIFNPAFLETFLEFEKAIGAQALFMSSKKREVIFYARHSKNMFEPGHLLKPVNVQTLRDIFEDLDVLWNVIEVLKLNPYVGL